jgi:hypothetical protein
MRFLGNQYYIFNLEENGMGKVIQYMIVAEIVESIKIIINV